VQYVRFVSATDPEHEASLIYVVGRVNQGIRRRMRQSLAQWNLSVQEFTTLSVLSARPGLSNAQLARRALVTPQAMIEILSKLEGRGLVRRDVDPSHGRILRAELTPAANDLLALTNPEINGIQDDLLASVPDRDRAATMRAMRIAMTNLSGPAR
jgi:DNA-binding MarR family transcriptional regulator